MISVNTRVDGCGGGVIAERGKRLWSNQIWGTWTIFYNVKNEQGWNGIGVVLPKKVDRKEWWSEDSLEGMADILCDFSHQIDLCKESFLKFKKLSWSEQNDFLGVDMDKTAILSFRSTWVKWRSFLFSESILLTFH